MDNNGLLEYLSKVVIISVVFTLLGGCIFGYVFKILWGWFIAPLGVSDINLFHAIGIALTVGLFTVDLPDQAVEGGESLKEIYMSTTLKALGMVAITLVLGWISFQLM